MSRRIIPEHESIMCDRCLADILPGHADTLYRERVPIMYDLCPSCAVALVLFIAELVVES